MSSLVCDGKKPPFQKTAAITVMKSLDIVQDSGQLADTKPCSVALTLNGWNTTKRLEITMAMHWSWKLPNMDRSCSSTKTLPVEIGRNNESQSSTGHWDSPARNIPRTPPRSTILPQWCYTSMVFLIPTFPVVVLIEKQGYKCETFSVFVGRPLLVSEMLWTLWDWKNSAFALWPAPWNLGKLLELYKIKSVIK